MESREQKEIVRDERGNVFIREDDFERMFKQMSGGRSKLNEKEVKKKLPFYDDLTEPTFTLKNKGDITLSEAKEILNSHTLSSTETKDGEKKHLK